MGAVNTGSQARQSVEYRLSVVPAHLGIALGSVVPDYLPACGGSSVAAAGQRQEQQHGRGGGGHGCASVGGRRRGFMAVRAPRGVRRPSAPRHRRPRIYCDKKSEEPDQLRGHFC